MTAKVIRINEVDGSHEQLREAAQAVDAGGLVAFPTETVYGIACRAARDSISRLDDVKGRDTKKHYTLHIGRNADYRTYVPSADLRVENLIRRAWPGLET